uniref:Ras GTPase-activating protein-binding protein 2 n=1 Tax=Cyprinus carpio TaxID=7962 RepID=A0A8C2D3E0_CYPCA
MVMEKPSPLLVGREFVRQYYTLLNKAPDYLHRFYGRSSSYVHGGQDSSGKPEEAVFGQAEIHKKVMSLQFSECHTKIRHVDAHATLGDGVVVQVMGELSNSGQPMRRFMQTFILAPEGSAVNKFYVHNDIFRYEEEVFGDSEAEMGGKFTEHTHVYPRQTCYLGLNSYTLVCVLSNGVEEQQEVVVPEAEPEPQPEPNQETEAELNLGAELQTAETELEEEELLEEERGSTPGIALTPPPLTPEPPKPRVELKQDTQSSLPRDQQRDRPGFHPRGPRGGRGDGDAGDMEGRRFVRYPDSHQLFVGNLPHDIDEGELKDFFMTFGNVVEMRINTKGVGGKLPNFGFVVFDDSEPVQRILGAKPIMFSGEVRLNVEEKKTRAARERETRGVAEGRRGPRGPLGNSMGRASSRGGMSRFTGPRR